MVPMNQIAVAIVVSVSILAVCLGAGVFFGMRYFTALIENIAVLKASEKPEDVSRIKNALSRPDKKDIKKVAEYPDEVAVDSLGTFEKALSNIHSRQ